MQSHHRHRAILSLSFPIIGGMISQNVVNIVDTAMVGQVGTSALASVGLGSLLSLSVPISSAKYSFPVETNLTFFVQQTLNN